MNKATLNNAATLIGRSMIAAIFIVAAAGKITNYAGTQGYMESLGVPGLLLPLVIAVEILGGIAIILGYQTKIAAFLLAGFTLLTAIIFHTDFGQQMEMMSFMRNMAITGAFLLLFVHGPGQWALNPNN
jgi:putative oxidoreductase